MVTLANKERSTPVVRKTVQNKAGPGESISLVMTIDKAVGEYLRLFVGTSGGSRREVVLHRPLGVTELSSDDWVVSEPTDIPILISRRKDPNAEKISTARNRWLSEQLVAEGMLVEQADGSLTYPPPLGGTRPAFFSILKEEYKNANPTSKMKDFSLGEAISKSADPRAKAETDIRSKLTELKPEADRMFTTAFRTMGGSRGERPQVPLGWAKYLSTAEIADAVILHGVDGPPFISETGDVGATATVAAMQQLVAEPPTGQENQWCFLPDCLPKDTKAEIKKSFKTIKDVLEQNGGKKFLFAIHEAKNTN